MEHLQTTNSNNMLTFGSHTIAKLEVLYNYREVNDTIICSSD